MKIQTILLALAGVILLAYFIWAKLLNKKTEPDTDTTRPSAEHLPKQERQNDKLVIVHNATSTEMDSILSGFCNMYNKEQYDALPRLYKTGENQFAITFPYDIEFDIYCFLINYVHYPIGFNKSFDVKGWATTKSGQIWITEKSANKQVLLFIPADDAERDNVYLTTADNIGYKLGFAMGEQKQLLAAPKEQFTAPNMGVPALANKEHKNYK